MFPWTIPAGRAQLPETKDEFRFPNLGFAVTLVMSDGDNCPL